MWLPALFLCFSPEVDVAAGIVVGILGIDALRHTTDRRYFGLALIPVVLGVHQMIEAVAWWGLQGKVDAATGESAITLYLVLAFVLVPLLVPVAIIGVEPDVTRRRWMVPSLVAGCVAASVLALALAEGPVRAAIGGRYIAYSVQVEQGGLVVLLYVVATCVPLLLSSHRRMVIFGAANIVVVAGLSWLQATALISLWCAWAAIGSIVIAAYVRSAAGGLAGDDRRRQQRHRTITV
jgi:hypothetical protein